MTWTSLEELLLAAAVNRHGERDWEVVAMEIQTRTSQPPGCFAPNACRIKFQSLRRRFRSGPESESGPEGRNDVVFIVEELRKVRLADLKEEIARRDLNIKRLEAQVKRLQEELERDLSIKKQEEQKSQNGDVKPDPNPPENDKTEPAAGEGAQSSGENRSFNESNSTEKEKTGTGPVEPAEPAEVRKTDSANDSSKTSEEQKVEESEEEVKESSDVQSTASLSDRRRTNAVADRDATETVVKKEETAVVKPELAEFLDVIRSHKHGSVFERRLDSQKTEKYEAIIREHVDLRMVQNRASAGSYSSCPLKFYLDLVLLFTNAIVFFPKSSKESAAARELLELVLSEMKRKQISPSAEAALHEKHPQSDSLVSKHKAIDPIVVCRKRSSISNKPLSASKVEKEIDDDDDDNKPLVIPKLSLNKSSSSNPSDQEKPVTTGARTMRRSNTKTRINLKSISVNSKIQSLVSNSGSNVGGSSSKGSEVAEKKKIDPVKKKGAADFLKRMKKGSPDKGGLDDAKKEESEKETHKKKVDERRDGTPRQKNGGRGAGKQASLKDDISPIKRGRPSKKGKPVIPASAPAKRGRESCDVDAKRPNKRAKR